MGNRPSVAVHSWRRHAAVTLAAGANEATFLPEIGMLGVSIRHAGHEILDLPATIAAYEQGHTTGLPLCYPWANRLAQRGYTVAGRLVDLTGVDLPTDPNGLPIHGAMAGARGWCIERIESTRGGATLRARYDFEPGAPPFDTFPFPHRLTIEACVDDSLTVATSVRPTGDVAVPISFGYHPYFRLPGARRSSVRLGLPARQHAELDELGLPTGAATLEQAEVEPLADRSLDDLYIMADRRVSLESSRWRLVVHSDDGFPFTQVFAPSDRNFVAIEPMTALTDALVTGSCVMVPPGSEFTARFGVAIDG